MLFELPIDKDASRLYTCMGIIYEVVVSSGIMIGLHAEAFFSSSSSMGDAVLTEYAVVSIVDPPASQTIKVVSNCRSRAVNEMNQKGYRSELLL